MLLVRIFRFHYYKITLFVITRSHFFHEQTRSNRESWTPLKLVLGGRDGGCIFQYLSWTYLIQTGLLFFNFVLLFACSQRANLFVFVFGKWTWRLKAALVYQTQQSKHLLLFESLASLCKSLPILVLVIMDKLVIKMSWLKSFERSLDVQDDQYIFSCMSFYLEPAKYLEITQDHWIKYSLWQSYFWKWLFKRHFFRMGFSAVI